jgi:hypothetical protein
LSVVVHKKSLSEIKQIVPRRKKCYCMNSSLFSRNKLRTRLCDWFPKIVVADSLFEKAFQKAVFAHLSIFFGEVGAVWVA